MKHIDIINLKRAIMLLFALVLNVFTAQAANQTINSNLDTNVAGTLRYALNQQAANDIYTFSSYYTITLTSALPQIISNGININNTSRTLSISGNNSYSIFSLSSAVNTITLKNMTLLNGKTTSSGAAIYFENSLLTNTINTSGTFILKGNVADSRGGAIFSAGNLEITGAATFGGTLAADVNSAGMGGAIYLADTATNLTLGGASVFQKNHANSHGGAIYFANAFAPGNTISNAGTLTFDGNSAQQNGGAIFTYGPLEITGAVTFGGVNASNGNTAIQGGAICLGSNANTLTLGGNTVFRNNVATSSIGSGGAIYSQVLSSSLTINNAGTLLFDKNSAAYGGAIYTSRNFEITHAVSFTGNTANNMGGAIYYSSSGIYTMTFGGDTTFSGNKSLGVAASDGGGAIYLVTNGSNIIDNKAALTFVGNTAGNFGGAIYSNGNLTIKGDVTFGGVNAIDKNTATNYGGAIYLGGNTLTLGGLATFQNNAVTVANISGGYGKGGAIYFASAGANTINNTGLLTFIRNSATNLGGAIYSSGNLAIIDAVKFGSAIATDGNIASASGGAIALAGNTLTFGSTADFVNNATSISGGAIHFASASANTISNTGLLTFEYNKTNSQGGAIYSLGTLTITGDSTFASNSAGSGGAIYSGGALTISGAVEFGSIATDGNIALASGGAIALAGNTLTFGSTADFAYNEAGSNGGAIYFESANANTISNTGLLTFNSNKTNFQGGAIFSNGALTIEGDATFSSNTATNNGGAIYLVGNTLTLGSTVDFAYNEAGSNGGAIYFESANANAINNTGLLTFEYNTATNNGGAIYSGGALTIEGDATFSSNTANYSGGAIYLVGNTLTLGSTVDFAYNEGRDSGGAIYFASANANTISNTGLLTFEYNTSTNGGGAIYSGGALIITGNTTFTGNTSTNDYGGAIYSGGALTICGDATFAGNTARNGGAIYSDGAVAIGGDSTFAGNTASYGGAIYSRGNLTITGDVTFGGAATSDKNTATNYGGAIYLTGNTLTLGGLATFQNNAVTVVDISEGKGSGGAIYFESANANTINNTDLLTFEYNTATNYGGAIYSRGVLTITGNTTFTGNTSTNDGGAIYSGGALTIGGDSTFTGNTASYGGAIYSGGAVAIGGDATFAGNTASYGGAIYSRGNLTITGDVTFGGAATSDKNTATNYGGAIYLTGNTLTLGGLATFQNNAVTVVDISGGKGSGGAIYFESANANTINNTDLLTFEYNTATNYGGAIYSGGALTIGGDATFSSNTANYSGGAIYSRGALTIGGDATFTGNTSTNNGGAIFSVSAVTITGDATFASNTVTNNGGAIYLAGNTLTLGGLTTFQNNANISGGSGRGGAIYFESADANTINNTDLLTFEYNTATNYGGAIYSGGALTIGGNTTFTGNTATNYGGAIYLLGNTLTLGGLATFQNNAVTVVDISEGKGSGGAIYFASANANTINNTDLLTFEYNAATNSGGAIYSEGALTITGNTTFTGNTASYGGAIYSNGALAIEGDATFTGSTASNLGGAIYLLGDTLTLGGLATFQNNAVTVVDISGAKGRGGAIYFISVSTNTINNTDLLTFGHNTATNNGGAIYSNGNLTITGAVKFGSAIATDGNIASANGGAIALEGNTLTFGSTADFAYNEASSIGGAIYFVFASANTINSTGLLTFESNTAGLFGGAIYSGGALTIGGDSTFTGNTASYGGAIYSGDALTITGSSAFTGNYASGNGGAILSNGTSLTLYAKTGDISFSGNRMGVDFSAADPSLTGVANSIYLVSSNMYIAADSGNSIIFSDPIKPSSTTARTVSINKLSDGTVTSGKVIFSGANYAAGSDDVKSDIKSTTTVYGGTLSVTQKAEYGVSDSTLYVNSGAKLMGSGRILGSTVISSGATLAPGDSLGTMTFENLTLFSGSILEIENGDLINILGALIGSGVSSSNRIILDLFGFESEIVDYKIISAEGSISFPTGNLNDFFDFKDKFAGDIYRSGNDIYLNGMIIPEPSTYAVIFALLALGFVIYRRRK